MLVAGALAFVIEMVVDRFWTVGYRVRSWSRSVSMSLLLIGAVATVLLEGVPWLLTRLSDYALDSASAWAGLIHQLGLVPTALCNEVLAHHDACGVTGRGLPCRHPRPRWGPSRWPRWSAPFWRSLGRPRA